MDALAGEKQAQTTFRWAVLEALGNPLALSEEYNQSAIQDRAQKLYLSSCRRPALARFPCASCQQLLTAAHAAAATNPVQVPANLCTAAAAATRRAMQQAHIMFFPAGAKPLSPAVPWHPAALPAR